VPACNERGEKGFEKWPSTLVQMLRGRWEVVEVEGVGLLKFLGGSVCKERIRGAD
jgi:hypothetical protein